MSNQHVHTCGITAACIVCLAIGDEKLETMEVNYSTLTRNLMYTIFALLFRVYILQRSITELLVQSVDVQFMSGSLCPWRVCLLSVQVG